MNEVIIVGAGLSGLTAGYQLKQLQIPFTLLEARDRIGGRIHTVAGPIEMGATWFGNQHTHLRQFLNHLEIEPFEQFTQGKISYDLHSQAPVQYMEMPQGQPPSYRIKGGSASIIDRLASEISEHSIQLNTTIKTLQDQGDSVLITDTKGQEYESSFVIITIPPQLLAHQVTFAPALPSSVHQLMAETHTWMGESIKFALSYERPFWKENGFSGMGFGQVGVIQEIHDHSDAEDDFYSLKGFLRNELASISQVEREDLVKAQVVKLFGEEAANYISYYDCVWIDEAFTSIKEAAPLMPHQNNGHQQLGKPLMNDKVFLAGTESSPAHGGYMDGAVYAGMKAAQQIERLLNASQ